MTTTPKCIDNVPFSAAVSVDPDNIVSASIKQQACDINRTYDKVFNPSIPLYKAYHGNISVSGSRPTDPPGRTKKIIIARKCEQRFLAARK